MKKSNKLAQIVIFAAILLLVLVFLYSGLQILESTIFNKGNVAQQSEDRKTIVRDGVEYYQRQDITTILLAGIDETGPMQANASYNNSGEADMVCLIIFDEKREQVEVLNLNRDTMLEIPVLGLSGKPAGTIYGQLALAHTYGSGLADSSQNLQNTVSDLFYGMSIDYYITLNMDAIAKLNDAVGGVTVTVTDDFSEVDPTISMGEVTLQGQQAVSFVRTRQGLGTQLNVSRMERHKEYMAGFVEAFKAKMNADSSFVASAFAEAGDYMVTDCSVNVLSALLDQYSDYELGSIVSLEGENVKGEKYMEYYLDEDDLDRVILEYLFAPKKWE